MALPQPFTTTSPIIASYDFYDLSTLTGNKTFYCGDLSTGKYMLTTIPFYSQQGYLVNAHDTDFDLKVNESTILKGDAIVNIPWKVFHQSPAGASTWTCTVKLYHYDGTTETELASDAISFNTGVMQVDTTKNLMGAFKLSNINRYFASGDIIRFNIVVSAVGGAGQTYMGIDPKNRASIGQTYGGDWPVSQTSITLPFKLDL